MKRTRLSRISAVVIIGILLMSLVSACSGGVNVAYTASIGIAKEASITIDIPYENAAINPINTNSINFFEGHLDAVGDIQFSVEGTEIRRATLSENVPENLDLGEQTPFWSMRLSTDIPLEVDLTNAGSLSADFTPFANLTSLHYTQNGGDANIILPTGENLESLSIVHTGGDLNIVTPANASITTDIAAGDGAVTINVPFEASVKVNFLAESAEITLPDSYSTSDTEDGFVSSYVSASYDPEAEGPVFNIDATAGNLVIQYREPPTPEEQTTDDATSQDSADASTDTTATDSADSADTSTDTTATDSADSADTSTDATATDSADSADTSTDATATDSADSADTTATEDADMPATILDAVSDVPELETFLQAVSNAELIDALSAEGPVTVFAPTNEAFVEAADSLAMGVDGLLEETTTLSIYLQFHVIEGNILAADIQDGMRATSLQGSDLVFSIDENGVVTVNGAEIITTDIVAENGVIHIIDAVLIPE